jgi:hypothetical protein
LNFNIIILLFLFSSCGLKKNPIVPKNNALPVISDRYKVIYSKVKSEEKEETTKDKKKK